MTRCPLCGRAYHAGILAPVWWHHFEVCRRPRCRAAAEDALVAVEHARERYDPLIKQIAQRSADSRGQFVAHGRRGDVMSRMDHDDDDWGALAAAKHHHRGESDA